MPPSVGEVWTHDKFFPANPSGKQRAHLLVLAVTEHSVTWRKLTTKATGRPQHPRCCHGVSNGGLYPCYYLGSGLLPALTQDTWVDLLLLDDEDALDFASAVSNGDLHCAGQLLATAVCDVLRCTESAPTTPKYQVRQVRDSRVAHCP